MGPNLINMNRAILSFSADVGLRHPEVLGSGMVNSLSGLDMNSLIISVQFRRIRLRSPHISSKVASPHNVLYQTCQSVSFGLSSGSGNLPFQ